MAEMLETLLKTPPLATAEQIMIQAGKPAVFMNAQGAQQAVGSPIAAADAEAMIMQARVKAGWITEADLAKPAEEAETAEDQPA